MRNTAPRFLTAFIAVAALPLAACGDSQTEAEVADDAPLAANEEFEWPESVAAMDAGFPSANSECRRLNDSPNTTEFVTDDAQLVGCPDAVTADALGGAIVGELDGVTLVSISDAQVEELMQRPVRAGEGLTQPVGTDGTTMTEDGMDASVPPEALPEQ